MLRDSAFDPSLFPHSAGFHFGDLLLALDPGVPLAEAVAQLAKLKAAKIFGSARPGKTLLIEARLLGRLGPLVQAERIVRVKDQIILTAQHTLAGALN